MGWESVTWGWPQSRRATSTWHLKDGESSNKAHYEIDYFRNTWRSFADDSHGATGGWDNKYTVRGIHWWAQTVPFNGMYNYKTSVATDCNLSQW